MVDSSPTFPAYHQRDHPQIYIHVVVRQDENAGIGRILLKETNPGFSHTHKSKDLSAAIRRKRNGDVFLFDQTKTDFVIHSKRCFN